MAGSRHPGKPFNTLRTVRPLASDARRNSRQAERKLGRSRGGSHCETADHISNGIVWVRHGRGCDGDDGGETSCLGRLRACEAEEADGVGRFDIRKWNSD